MHACVLITRWKAVFGTGRSTGAPSIGIRIAGVLLTMIWGGAFCTATCAGWTVPDAASDAWRRSSEIVCPLVFT